MQYAHKTQTDQMKLLCIVEGALNNDCTKNFLLNVYFHLLPPGGRMRWELTQTCVRGDYRSLCFTILAAGLYNLRDFSSNNNPVKFETGCITNLVDVKSSLDALVSKGVTNLPKRRDNSIDSVI